MVNSDYVFGDLKEAGDYELPGADLSIYPIKKDRFKEVMFQNKVPPEQAKAVWKFYTDETSKAYDKARLQGQGAQQSLTREALAGLQMDRTGFDAMAKEAGIDPALVTSLFNAYDTEVRAIAETAIKAQEQAGVEAEGQEEEAGEAQETIVSDGVAVHMSKQDAQFELDKIVNNPSDIYWKEDATTGQRDRRVALTIRLREIIAGVTDRLDGYDVQLQTEKEELTKEQYGVSSLKPGAFNSSNDERPNKSQEQPDTQQGSIGTSGEGRSSASGGRIEDGGGEEE